jgi:hypothetical protein
MLSRESEGPSGHTSLSSDHHEVRAVGTVVIPPPDPNVEALEHIGRKPINARAESVASQHENLRTRKPLYG